jgi:hypothetical protein
MANLGDGVDRSAMDATSAGGTARGNQLRGQSDPLKVGKKVVLICLPKRPSTAMAAT